ncbi:MAG: SRPBCC family protein [Deltaproteobacteria bacterium]|nr:SRPBCC family protein [Deltaproteobacteria bacterium]
METLKKVIFGIAVFLVLFLAFGYLLPKQVEVSRSIDMHATTWQIHPYVDNLERWKNWMPWNKEMDPSVKYTFSGAKRGQGARMSWSSDKMGSGELTITKSAKRAGVWYSIYFHEGHMESLGSLTYQPVPNGTKVIWKDIMEMGNNPINRYFGLLLDAMLGADFETGLAKLKEVVEKSSIGKAQ